MPTIQRHKRGKTRNYSHQNHERMCAMPIKIWRHQIYETKVKWNTQIISEHTKQMNEIENKLSLMVPRWFTFLVITIFGDIVYYAVHLLRQSCSGPILTTIHFWNIQIYWGESLIISNVTIKKLPQLIHNTCAVHMISNERNRWTRSTNLLSNKICNHTYNWCAAMLNRFIFGSLKIRPLMYCAA